MKFGFQLFCPGMPAIEFVPDDRERIEKTIRLKGKAAMPCDYPEFRVIGHPQDFDTVTQIALDSPHLSRQ